MNLTTLEDKSFAGKWRARLPKGIKMKYQAELDYAKTIISDSDILSKTTEDSVKHALMSAAMIGVSLNPDLGLAYLTPYRNKKKQVLECKLHVSYKGMMSIVERSGSVQWVKAKVVYENEPFEYIEGTTTEIRHKIVKDARKRGAIVGAYCVAKLENGDLAVEYMDHEQLDRARAASKTDTNKLANPWNMWHEEMCRKTVIRRAWKYWPKSQGLDALIEVMNREEGGARFSEIEAEAVELMSDDHVKEITETLKTGLPDVEHDKWLNRLAGAFGAGAIAEIPDARFKEVKLQLDSAIETKQKGSTWNQRGTQ